MGGPCLNLRWDGGCLVSGRVLYAQRQQARWGGCLSLLFCPSLCRVCSRIIVTFFSRGLAEGRRIVGTMQQETKKEEKKKKDMAFTKHHARISCQRLEAGVRHVTYLLLRSPTLPIRMSTLIRVRQHHSRVAGYNQHMASPK